jgi:hypothetical protein
MHAICERVAIEVKARTGLCLKIPCGAYHVADAMTRLLCICASYIDLAMVAAKSP